MNSQLAIIVLIDVEAALAANSLQGHAYLVDDNRHMGSTGQGTGNLTTVVVGCQIVNWLIAGIDLSGTQPFPALEAIGGDAVAMQIMIPQLFDSPALDGSRGLWWGGTVDAAIPGIYKYTLHVNIAGTRLSLEAAVDVRTGFTMDALPALRSRSRLGATLANRASADGSLQNPDQHVGLLSRDQRARLRQLMLRRGQ
jgi:hypothetical protein